MQKKDVLNHIGNRIKELRKQKKLTQRDLAFACNKDPQSIERVENGKSNPTIFYLYELSKALEILLKDLFDFEIGKTN
ncbi:MAG: helix-turn-helix domain-containing protein [Bacteroidia bacterium]